MSAGSSPSKKNVLVFKQRETPPANDHNVADSVSLFRRAHEFFPLVVEETQRSFKDRKDKEKALRIRKKRKEKGAHTRAVRVQAGQQNGTGSGSGSGNGDGDGDAQGETTKTDETLDAKRRKMSAEEVSSGASDKGDFASGDDIDQGNGQYASREERAGTTTLEPPRRQVKSKGVATQRTTNAGVRFRDTSQVPFAELAPATTTATTRAAGDDFVILIDDEDGDDYDGGNGIAGGYTSLRRKQSTPPHKDTSNDTGEDMAGNALDAADPEFLEYIIRARVRKQAAETAKALQEASAGIGSSGGGGEDSDDIEPLQRNRGGGGGRPHTVPDELPYRIFITPHLPYVVPPLLANVRMNQKMQFVQDAFLDHARRKGAELSPADASSIVLTWKGAKLYSWTTGQSLGIRPDASGRLPGPGVDDDDGDAFMSGGLHLEIWTLPLYDAYLQEQEKRRQRNLGEVTVEDLASSDEEDGGGGGGGSGGGGGDSAMGGGDGGSDGGGGGGSNGNLQRVRLVLKSQEYEKLSMTAYSNTKVAILIAAFREQRQIGLDMTVSLFWDGDRLDEDTTVGDAEMEDMDTVEVYVR